MIKRIFILTALVLVTNFGISQDLLQHEKAVNNQLIALRKASNDQEKLKRNKALKDTLTHVLSQKGAFTHQFSSLKSMGTITSPDNKFRFFNWNIEMDNHTQKYECLMMIYDTRTKKYKVIEFKDNSLLLPPRPTSTLTSSNWYGALYYKIIPKKKGSKTYYTLLGYDGNNQTSTIKIVDALTITGTRVKLGAPIFLTDDGVEKRLFFEYSKMATMSLKYQDNRDLIIMDHLAPESPNLEGFREYYVPDLTYDAMAFQRGKWVTRKNIIATNSESRKKISVYAQQQDGKLHKKEINNKWITPNDKNSPIDNGNHEAITPEKKAKLSDKDLIKKKKKDQKHNSIYPSTKRRKGKKKKQPRSILDY